MGERIADVADVLKTGPCAICGSPGPHLPYRGRFLCPTCSLMGCGRCWKARIVERWSPWWTLRRKPLLLRCPNCGWKTRVKR